MRVLKVIFISFVISACALSGGNVNNDHPLVTISVYVNCGDGPATNATVRLNNQMNTTNQVGLATFLLPTSIRSAVVVANSAECAEQTQTQQLHGVPATLLFNLVRNVSPIVLPTKATGEALTFVQANFCNLKDSKGRVVFTPFIISLNDEERKEWYDIQRSAGSTHVVLSPTIDYTDSPIPGRDLLANPVEFKKYIVEALETVSADGLAFRPIIILDTGDPNPRARIDTYWAPLINEIRDLLDYVIIVPGWELIKASYWTSAEYSYALGVLHNLGVEEIWAHFSTGRAAGSSNPIENDDPWQGAEREFWTTNNGQYLKGLLYQAEPLQNGDNPFCDASSDNCWLNRFEDVVPRLGNGMNGWRIVHLVLFEDVAYYYYRNRASDDLVRDIATAGKQMCDKYSVKCGFGNGLPRN